jgi:hypothetical protein
MATKNFTQFSTTTLTSGDYIVGYKQDGSAELKATVKQIIDLVQDSDNQTLSYDNGNLSISSGNSVALSGFNAVNAQTQLLSAGTDLFDIFLTSETDSQTLLFNETNKDLSISSGNTVSLSALVSATPLGTTAGTYAEGNAPRTIDVTHAELLSLMGSQNLKTGFYYRITDFVTEYISNDNEWISPSNTANVSNNNGTAFTVASIAATPEPLIVYAYSSNAVSKQAYSALYPEDIIYYDPTYTYLDGTNTAKGFIIYRKEPKRMLECDYDWRNVRFKRWDFSPSSTTSIGGGSSIAVSAFQAATEYLVADNVTFGTGTGAVVLHCIKKYTSVSTGSAGFYPSEETTNWIAFYNIGRGKMHDMALYRPRYGNENPAQTFLGGFSQAHYYYTFSNLNGTIGTDSFGNIKIEGFVSPTLQDYYWLRFNNIVLFRGVNTQTSEYRNLKFTKNCYKMTFYGISGKRNSHFENSNNIYIDGLFLDNKINDCSFGYFLTDTRRGNFSKCNQFAIHGQNLDLKCDNSLNFVIKPNSHDSEIQNCSHFSFTGGTAFSPITIKTKNPLKYNEKRSLFINPFLQTGISGTARTANNIDITSGASDIPHYEYRDENENLIRQSVYGTTPLLWKHADQSVVTRLETATDPSFKNIFTTQDHTTPTYVRNTDCWCNDLVEELTCISPWNSATGNPSGATGGGVLVTPRHIYMAAHFSIPTGSTVRFVTSNNQVVDRTIVQSYTHPLYNPSTGLCDITVGLLDSSVPSTITPAQTIPESFYDYLLQVSNVFSLALPFAGAMYTDQEEKALVIDYATSNKDFHDFAPPTNSLKLSAYETIVSGDSGNPVFFIINNKLVFLCSWTAVRSDGTAIGAEYISPLRINETTKAPTLQTMIENVDAAYGISTGLQLDIADFSSFVNFANN